VVAATPAISVSPSIAPHRRKRLNFREPCRCPGTARYWPLVCPSSVTDLFVVGLALDISGALLLARGLMLPPGAIARLGTFWGLHSGDVVARIEDRTDTEFGLVALITGFGLQAVGYALVLLGIEAATGSAEGVTALCLGVAAGLAVWALWRLSSS
jgi:hypothetical protein